MDRPERKPLRLKNYDYSAPGSYFITVCTHEKRCILSRIITLPVSAVGALHEAPAVRHALTQEGECVRRYIEAISTRWPEVSVDRYVIMPNHIHLLLQIHGERALHEAPLQDHRSLLAKSIGYLKMNSSRDIHAFRPGEVIWQRSYYDHVIRNDAEYAEIAEYIAANPSRWAEDRFHP